jgi:hypothetical protein
MDFSGSATVEAIDAVRDRLELNLGEARRLTLQARAGGKPLQVGPGTSVAVEYRTKRDTPGSRLVLGIRASGWGILRVTDSGLGQVSVSSTLFELVAVQGKPNPTSVEVQVGAGSNPPRVVVAPGQVTRIGNLNVVLLASRAVTGAAAERIEGNPYSIDLIAWPSP